MKRHQQERELRQTLDRGREHIRDASAADIASVARDAYEEGDKDRSMATLAKIPPVVLGKTTYRIVTANPRGGFTIVGPNGGISFLVTSTKNPTMFAHNTVSGKTTWYLRNPDGSFTKV